MQRKPLQSLLRRREGSEAYEPAADLAERALRDPGANCRSARDIRSATGRAALFRRTGRPLAAPSRFFAVLRGTRRTAGRKCLAALGSRLETRLARRGHESTGEDELGPGNSTKSSLQTHFPVARPVRITGASPAAGVLASPCCTWNVAASCRRRNAGPPESFAPPSPVPGPRPSGPSAASPAPKKASSGTLAATSALRLRPVRSALSAPRKANRRPCSAPPRGRPHRGTSLSVTPPAHLSSSTTQGSCPGSESSILRPLALVERRLPWESRYALRCLKYSAEASRATATVQPTGSGSAKHKAAARRKTNMRCRSGTPKPLRLDRKKILDPPPGSERLPAMHDPP